jgi:hypothetical protein
MQGKNRKSSIASEYLLEAREDFQETRNKKNILRKSSSASTFANVKDQTLGSHHNLQGGTTEAGTHVAEDPIETGLHVKEFIIENYPPNSSAIHARFNTQRKRQ